jgi:hypothetical protein
MKMIGHNNKIMQPHIRTQFGGFQSFAADNVADFIRVHFAVRYIAKHANVVLYAQCYTIYSCLCVIVILQANGMAMVYVGVVAIHFLFIVLWIYYYFL